MLDNFPNSFRRDDEEVFNEFRQKQVNFDLEERKNESDSSRSLFIGALGGLVMAAVVGWFVLAPRYHNMAPEEVPVITKPQNPVKIQPSEPGNIEFASQDRTVYEIIEKRQINEENDKVVSSEEEPNVAELDKLETESTATPTQINRKMTSESLVFSGGNHSVRDVLSENKDQQKEKSVANEETNDVQNPVEQKVEKKVEEEVEKAPIVITTESVKEAAKPAETPRAKIEKEEKIQSVPNGAWQVQLMSSPNKAAAQKSWVDMSNRYDILKNQPHSIEAADLGAKGVFYRLRVGSFANKDQASAFCSRLKSMGGNCFVSQK